MLLALLFGHEAVLETSSSPYQMKVLAADMVVKLKAALARRIGRNPAITPAKIRSFGRY